MDSQGQRRIDISRTKRIRGGHRGAVTRLIHQMDKAKEQQDVEQLKQIKQSLSNKLRILSQMDEELLGQVEDHQVDDEIQQADLVHEKAELALIRIDAVLEHLLSRNSTENKVLSEDTGTPPSPLSSEDADIPPHAQVTDEETGTISHGDLSRGIDPLSWVPEVSENVCSQATRMTFPDLSSLQEPLVNVNPSNVNSAHEVPTPRSILAYGESVSVPVTTSNVVQYVNSPYDVPWIGSPTPSKPNDKLTPFMNRNLPPLIPMLGTPFVSQCGQIMPGTTSFVPPNVPTTPTPIGSRYHAMSSGPLQTNTIPLSYALSSSGFVYNTTTPKLSVCTEPRVCSRSISATNHYHPFEAEQGSTHKRVTFEPLPNKHYVTQPLWPSPDTPPQMHNVSFSPNYDSVNQASHMHSEPRPSPRVSPGMMTKGLQPEHENTNMFGHVEHYVNRMPDQGFVPGVPPRVKLPKLSIRKFNGDLTKWTTFWDSFSSSIHSNPTLSSIDKFNYLSSLLESTAAEALAGLTPSHANYEEAVSTLKKRFGNTQLIINRHMDALLNLTGVSSQHDVKSLRKLCDCVEAHIRGLKTLGVPAQTYGGLLTSILTTKLPLELKLIVTRNMTEEKWDLEQLLVVLSREIDAREQVFNLNVSTKATLSRRPTAAALVTPIQNLTTDRSCIYCKKTHSSATCVTVTDPSARKELLRKEGRCFVCLKRHHLSRECRSTFYCKNCRGRHHSSICLRKVTRDTDQPKDSAKKLEPPKATTAYAATSTNILLQTATLQLVNLTHDNIKGTARAIMDGGSQRSYITDRLRKRLNLPSDTSETLQIETFGSQAGQEKTCDIARFA